MTLDRLLVVDVVTVILGQEVPGLGDGCVQTQGQVGSSGVHLNIVLSVVGMGDNTWLTLLPEHLA